MREQTIVFVTNLQDDLEGGISLATQLAMQKSATLIFLHVIPMRAEDGEGMLYSGLEVVSSRKEKLLRSLVPTHAGVPYRHVLRVGEPLAHISDVVEQEGAEMVVLSVPKRSFWSRLWRQDLWQQVQYQVSCPVVTFHAGSTASKPSSLWRRQALLPEHLEALLCARTDALLGWLNLQRKAIQALSQRSSIQDAIVSLVRGERWSLEKRLQRRIKTELALELGEFQQALGAIGVEVHSPYSETPLLCLGQKVPLGAARKLWLERLQRRGSDISLPFMTESTNGLCVLQSGACVSTVDGPPALLLFTLDARRDFFRILAQPGPTPSLETYAFNQDGLMLSYSRFPDQLRRIGLLPFEPGAQTPCRLQLLDPGRNLLRGQGLPQNLRQLTRMAAAAISGEDGHDWNGYRDYRGVPVVGAWRWLPDYGFGVAAEMDVSSVA